VIATADYSGIALLIFLIIGVSAVAGAHWVWQQDKALGRGRENDERERMRRHLERHYPEEAS